MLTQLDRAPTVSDVGDDLFHGAHLECQADAPFVTLTCGRVANWDEQDDQNGRENCPLCWNADRCPICRMRLRRS